MFDFDETINRRKSESLKWNTYPEDVIPMWVADMDFQSPPAVLHALEERVKHGVFGYGVEEPGLRESVCTWVEKRYHWKIDPSHMLFVPGVVTGLNWAVRQLLKPGAKFIIQTPVYPPFYQVAQNADLCEIQIPLIKDEFGYYSQDIKAFEAAIDENTQGFILCNPHNPVGRVFTKPELTQVAEVCKKNNLIIFSDEIHGDLIYEGNVHVPIASIDSEISKHSVTLIAPSKTFNIAGLYCSVLICQNENLLSRLSAGRNGIVVEPNLLAQVAARAAYENGEGWLSEIMVYLDRNRRLISDFLKEEMPELKYSMPEGTFLGWIDCSELRIGEDPAEFFLREARVAFSPGHIFGDTGKSFVRINFGCTYATLIEVLERIKIALRRKLN